MDNRRQTAPKPGSGSGATARTDYGRAADAVVGPVPGATVAGTSNRLFTT